CWSSRSSGSRSCSCTRPACNTCSAGRSRSHPAATDVVSESEKALQPDPPSGIQHEIRHADQVAVVTEVGATLRAYSAGGLDVPGGLFLGEPPSAGTGG